MSDRDNGNNFMWFLARVMGELMVLLVSDVKIIITEEPSPGRPRISENTRS